MEASLSSQMPEAEVVVPELLERHYPETAKNRFQK